jgi:Asp-tRNA(Asn)/Glu-tRNA(Gln) amidotransferase B subunit
VNWDSVYQLCRTGTAIGGSIQKFSRFDRKHYFYPDLPTAYQITQQFYPLIIGGQVLIHNEDYETLTREFEAQLHSVTQNKTIGKKKMQRILEQQERELKKREKLGNT